MTLFVQLLGGGADPHARDGMCLRCRATRGKGRSRMWLSVCSGGRCLCRAMSPLRSDPLREVWNGARRTSSRRRVAIIDVCSEAWCRYQGSLALQNTIRYRSENGEVFHSRFGVCKLSREVVHTTSGSLLILWASFLSAGRSTKQRLRGTTTFRRQFSSANNSVSRSFGERIHSLQFRPYVFYWSALIARFGNSCLSKVKTA